MRFTNARWMLTLLLVTLSPCHPVTLSGAEPPPKQWTAEEWTQAVERLRVGMTTDQVRQVLGQPRRIGRQILYQRYIEQWVYDTPLPFRLEFDCRRGQRPSLLPLPSTAPPAPRDGKRQGG